MTAKSTKSKTNRKKTGTTSKKSTSNKKTTKKNTKKTTRSTMTAKSGNSFLMDEILIWITLAVSIILLIFWHRRRQTSCQTLVCIHRCRNKEEDKQHESNIGRGSSIHCGNFSLFSCHFTYFVLNYLINVDNIIF